MSETASGIDVAATTAHICRRIRETPVTREPWPHLVVDEFLPADVFQQVVAALPEAWLRAPPPPPIGRGWVALLAKGGFDAEPLSELDWWQGCDRERAVVTEVIRAIGRQQDVFDALKKPLRKQLLAGMDRFRARFENEIKPRLITRLTRDAACYDLRPHTDIPDKFVSIVAYVRADQAPKLGTVLYEPLVKGYTDPGGLTYHDTAKFREAAIVPFRPNSALVFVRGDDTFHGVAFAPTRADFARVTIQSNFFMAARIQLASA